MKLTKNLSFRSKKYFSHQNEQHTASYIKLFCCFESVLKKVTKNLSFGSKKCFSHQIEPHTATLNFSAVLKYFFMNESKNLSFRLKKCFLKEISHIQLH